MRTLNAWTLRGTRAAIDHVDDAMVLLLSARQRLAGVAGRMKRDSGRAQRDEAREREVHARAWRVARRSGLDEDSVTRLIDLLIGEAHRRQSCSTSHLTLLPEMPMNATLPSLARSVMLRCLPPPRRWRRVLKAVPDAWQATVLLRTLSAALASPEARRTLEQIAQRRLGIHVEDLDLRWTLELRDGRVLTAEGDAEATVSGSATDLLLLASRQEDADTLFFQRRLKLTGDTELGLLLRNLLDRLPWESLPLGSRIVLQRGSRLLREARDQHHHRRGARA